MREEFFLGGMIICVMYERFRIVKIKKRLLKLFNSRKLQIEQLGME